MTRIAVELVPRSEEDLISELELIKKEFPEVNGINVPDLLRFDLRSWDACTVVKRYYPTAIPHLRAIDISVQDPLPMMETLLKNEITEVLVLTGDPPQSMTRKVYPTTSIDMIRKFKKELPHIKVYAAIDPYRDSLRKEYDYIRRKIDAGADGFFTQPFFDLRYMEIFAELFGGLEVFWGVSPVTSEKSVSYWETKNHVVFPADFQPTLAWNSDFARKALAFARETKGHIYFMPIRTDLKDYLSQVFAS
ncbi:methylenetetrahydrofolate reductase [Heliobacillus mobilis]|uniref:Methylenetetrahydrofolate reductase n=1 Tax=Heliobacterium mobile TaxID=28064 RepID=A0A6I3SJ26_HELMO|nr:methylenetetrahydrofolate reductase [Heliobacterium mobile]MTV48826.1 methylenetetrahydrofolate reductase [Heliobacterium mobile]